MNYAIVSTHFHHFWVLSELLILVTFALAKENKGKKVYKMKRIVSALFCASCLLTAHAQSRLSVGGYGEAAFSRNFYSDHVSRYSQPEEHKDDPSHGRFDIPHAVIYLGYDFGKGWTLGTEIEFEHGGTGIAYEKEDEEGGEWEQETEKGGEVELEQFWLQKTFAPWANLRVGHIVVPVGLNNAHHEPTNFFTVYRPEGENTIMPSTWHQTGISFWGRYGKFRYEAQLLAGLNADNFTNVGWIKKGHKSPMEFDVGTKYKGRVAIGSIDFTYNAHNWIVRGQADYGYLGSAEQLKYMYNRKNSKSPFKHSAYVSSNAYAIGIEAGYDIFSQIASLREDHQKFYVFGRYETYNPYASDTKDTHYGYTKVQRIAAGINYKPIKEIVVKAEYSHRFLDSQYNNEPSINIGIAYEGFFK